jgi:potassium inwardly-rectifying channel subfamily J
MTVNPIRRFLRQNSSAVLRRVAERTTWLLLPNEVVCLLGVKRVDLFRRAENAMCLSSVLAIGNAGTWPTLFTTLIEMQWRYHILLFTLQFLLTWCIFGAVYYAIAAVHGDTYQAENNTWVPCIANVYDYTSAFLFSLETQATIGYGLRVVNSVCEFAVLVVIVQTCAGTCVQMLATGVLFAKISRPKGRAKTLLFSRTAVICLEDGEYQLMFRVGDMRTKSHIIGSSIRALMVRSQLTADGELLPLHQEPLTLCIDACDLDDTCLFMVWPVTIVHKIDDSSPLWDISAEQLIAEQFEIIVILEGTVESTGSTTQVRTSYLPSEIRWGQRLEPLRIFHRETGCYAVDYSNFNETMPVPMPDCSARSWSENRGNSAEGAETVRYPIDQTSDNRSMASETIRSIQRIFRRRFTDFKSQRVNATVAEPVSNILRPLNVRVSRPSTSALQPREINNNNGIHLLHRITENKDESEYVCNQLQDHTWPATSPSQHTLLGKQNAEITSFGVPCKRRPLHAQRSIVRAKQHLLTQTKGVENDPAFTSPCRLPLQNFKLEIDADDDLENDQLVAKL